MLAGDAVLPRELHTFAQEADDVSDRIGVRHVAFGSDFDGATIPDALGDAAGMQRLVQALAEDGFAEAELEAIAWGNWRRVLAAWW